MEIQLQKINLYGFHGLHPGEEIIGGEFEVNLAVSFIPEVIPIRDIQQTLDYTHLLALVKERMQKPAKLLETLATEIASEIIAKYLNVTEVMVSIFKLHPPIENLEGKVGVSFRVKRN